MRASAAPLVVVARPACALVVRRPADRTVFADLRPLLSTSRTRRSRADGAVNDLRQLQTQCDLAIAHIEFMRKKLPELHDHAFAGGSSSIIGGGRGGDKPDLDDVGHREAKNVWRRLLDKKRGIAAVVKDLEQLDRVLERAIGEGPK